MLLTWKIKKKKNKQGKSYMNDKSKKHTKPKWIKINPVDHKRNEKSIQNAFAGAKTQYVTSVTKNGVYKTHKNGQFYEKQSAFCKAACFFRRKEWFWLLHNKKHIVVFFAPMLIQNTSNLLCIYTQSKTHPNLFFAPMPN